MSAVAPNAAQTGWRWMTVIQRDQNPRCGAAWARRRRPGAPILWPKKLSSAGSRVSEALRTSTTASAEAIATP
jgi:hypothetical protein